MDRILPSIFLTGLENLVSSYGKNAKAIAVDLGLAPAILSNPDLPISDIQFNAFMETCALVCDDQFFLMRLARRQSWNVIGPADEILTDALTVYDALTALVAYNNEHNPGLFCYLQESADIHTLCFEVRAYDNFDPVQLTGQLHMVDLSMAVYCNELQNYLGVQWRPYYTLFQYAEPADTQPLEQTFGEKLYFDQDVNGLCLTLKDCRQAIAIVPQSSGVDRVGEIAGSGIENIPIDQKVDRAIRLLINRGDCCAEQVAEVLDINLRTLQYQLKQRNTSYQQQYNTVRLDLARYYLGSSRLSVGAIGERLCFADTAAFSNFFQRHANCRPLDYKRQVRATE